MKADMPPLPEILADHRWLPQHINAELDEIQFIRLDRDGHRQLIFLEEKDLPADIERANFPLAVVAAAVERMPLGRVHFVFHSSLALSTLTARAFDVPGVAMTLREPVVLNEIAFLARAGRNVRPVLRTIVRLLARPFGDGELVIIKPSNIANILIPDLMTIAPAAHALFMHALLADFLGSVARKGMWGRIFYRGLFALLDPDGHLDTGFTSKDLFEQTDLQIAALAWLNHQAEFAHMLTEPFADRIRSVDSATFLARRREVMTAIAGHFDLSLDIDALLAGPAFNEHSKQPGRSFDATERERETAENDRLYGEEIGMVCEWAAKTFASCGEQMTLARPLVPGTGEGSG